MNDERLEDADDLSGVLPLDTEPPPALEDRVVHALRSAGALRPARRRRALGDWVAAAAIFAGAFVAGGQLWPGAIPAGHTTPRFLFLLYPGAVATDPSGAEEGSLVREYAEWAADLRRAGRGVSGDRLAQSPLSIVGGASDDSPDRAVNGFFIVQAASLAEATRVAQDSPHVRHGGRIVVRLIDTP